MPIAYEPGVSNEYRKIFHGEIIKVLKYRHVPTETKTYLELCVFIVSDGHVLQR